MSKEPFHIVLFEPEIPQNTGNIGRVCALTNTRLHLIHPLGFVITDSKLKRSGMDYWHSLDVHHHRNWEHFLQSDVRPRRLWLFTTKTTRGLWDARFLPGDGLVFGKESAGCPEVVHQYIGEAFRVKIPQLNASLRSHNLATSAGIGLYEALRQNQNDFL